MILARIRFVRPLLIIAVLTALPIPAVRAADAFTELQKKLFDEKREKEKDKDKDKKKKKDHHDDHGYAEHQHYDRDHDGRCDVCGAAIVVVREPVVVERRPYVERRTEVYVEPAPRRYERREEYVEPRRDSLEADVQAALRRNGYYRGPADGDIGPGTRAAIRDYQLDRGLPATGRIDRALLNSLGL